MSNLRPVKDLAWKPILEAAQLPPGASAKVFRLDKQGAKEIYLAIIPVPETENTAFRHDFWECVRGSPPALMPGMLC